MKKPPLTSAATLVSGSANDEVSRSAAEKAPL